MPLILNAAAHVNGPAVLHHNVAGDPQSQSGSDIALGSEKGLEQILAVVRRDADPRIEYGDPCTSDLRIAPATRPRDTNHQRAAGRHSVDGIADQVGERLAELPGECADGNIVFVLPDNL